MNLCHVLVLTLSLALLGKLCTTAQATRRGSQPLGSRIAKQVGTLVVYIYAEVDMESRPNLMYFLKHGVRADDGAHYVVVTQTDDALLADYFEELRVHDNVRFLRHNNECYDWGTFGWVVRFKITTAGYKYFIMLNSSVRGPFIPPYLGHTAWHKLLTERLTADVVAAGPTISCEGTPNRLNMSALRQNPHVQSYVFALSRVGLRILMEDGNVFKCWSERLDAIYHAELGASAAILRAGYNLDCLLQGYQGYDWRDRRNWGCNSKRSPVGQGLFANSTLSLYDLLFVKVKASLIAAGDTNAQLAVKYTKWKSVFRDITQCSA